MYPELTDDQVDQVTGLVRAWEPAGDAMPAGASSDTV
jgi:hypothetical protein